MKTFLRPVILNSLLATGMLVLSACGNSDKNTPAATTTAPSSSAATSPSAAASASTPEAMPAPAATSAAPASAGSSTPAPASTTAAAATPVEQGFAVTSVTVGERSKTTPQVVVSADTIPSDQNAIYASVETRGKTDGVTLGARWSYLEGKGQLVSAISQAIATEGPAVTTFKIQNPRAWPAGKYKVDISLDGKTVSSNAFEVKASS